MQTPEQYKEWRRNNPEKLRAYEAKRDKKQRAKNKAQWRAENPGKARTIAKKYRDTHPGKNADGARRWRKENPERAREIAFRSRIKREYGISAEEYLLRVENSGGVCGLCAAPFEIPNLDHCHKTGKLRDVLCQKCNRGLGHFNDSPELLRLAAQYLERHHSDSLRVLPFVGTSGL